MKLSILIPVYNEESTIEKVIENVKKLPIDKEIIVIDDCSKDKTYEILKKIEGIKVLHHEKNMGKGAAIKTGLNATTGEYAVIQDADLEYNPKDLIKMFEIAKKEKAKVIYGSRFKGKGKFLPESYIANKFLTFLTNLLFGAKITDMETCYKMMPTQLFKKLKIEANRFDIEPEITAKVCRLGYKIYEVPISYSARRKGKKIGVKDGFKAIFTLIKWKFIK